MVLHTRGRVGRRHFTKALSPLRTRGFFFVYAYQQLRFNLPTFRSVPFVLYAVVLEIRRQAFHITASPI